MSRSPRRVAVVGGGVIGVASAYYLARAGCAVTLVERDAVGMGCSHANCGLVCPSHVLPLAEPGVVGQVLRTLYRRDSPLSVKPRFDPELWRWIWKFARRCNTADMLEAAQACQALLESSMQLYRTLICEEALECEWETRGLLFVYRHRAAMEAYARTDELLRTRFGLPATRYDRDALTELEPALLPGLAGGWHYQADAHLRPDKLLSSWRQVLERLGVTVRERCEVRSFVRESGSARAVLTTAGDIAADAVVVATGALTPQLGRQLGARIPIQPGKGYSITMPRPARCPALPLMFPEHRVVVTPMRSAYRIGSMMEFSGYDAAVDPRRLTLLKSGASHYLREPYRDPVEEEWFGWRPMTYDGKPIVDRSPAMGNVYVAAGHNMLGLSMAPATGRLVAELVTGTRPHVDPAPYSLRRF
jgi:D-amino-acid dehydrogenase